jgi:hypothetical protein
VLGRTWDALHLGRLAGATMTREPRTVTYECLFRVKGRPGQRAGRKTFRLAATPGWEQTVRLELAEEQA